MKKRLKRVLSDVWAIIRLPEMTILPGQLAFFFVLSVVPIITLISYGATFLNLSMDFIREFIGQAFSNDVAELVIPVIQGNNLGVKFFISLAIGYFIASNGADSIIVTSNTIYGAESKGYARRRIKALIMTMLIVALFLFILLVPVFGNKIIELIKFVNLNENVTRNIELIIMVLKGPISWFIMFFFIKIIYTMAPDERISSSTVNFGAVFTSIFWLITTGIYSYFISNFARYDIFYGGLANIVVLMLWVYILAYIFVIGLALNNQETQLAKTGTINTEKITNNK